MAPKFDCANCGTRYSLFSPINTRFCKKEGLLYCIKCTKGRQCKFDQTPTSRWPAQVAIWLTIFSVIAAIGFAWNLPSYLHEAEVNGLGVTPMASLEPGKLVKIQGNIVAPQAVVISGYENTSSSSWTWVDLYNFNVTDGTHTLFVNITDLAFVNYGPHAFDVNAANHTKGNAFMPGDYVTLVGELSSTNSSVFFAQDLGMDPGDLVCCATDIALLFGIPLIITGALGATGFVVLAYRHRAHESALRALGGPKKVGVPQFPVPDTGVNWIPNPLYPGVASSFSRARWALLIPAGLLVFTGYSYWFLPQGPKMDGSLLLLTFFLGVVIFAVVTPLLARRSRTPVRVGFSDQGLYVEYRGRANPWTRPFGAWRGMTVAVSNITSKQGNLGLEWEGGRSFSILNLDPEIARRILTEVETLGGTFRLPGTGLPAIEPTLPGATNLPLTVSGPSTAEIDWQPSKSGTTSVKTRVAVATLVIGLGGLMILSWFLAPSELPIALGIFVGMLLGGGRYLVPKKTGIREVGLSDAGLFVRSWDGTEKYYPWSNMSLLVPYGLALMSRNASGTIETIGGLDAKDYNRILDRLSRLRNPNPLLPLPDQDPAWIVNPLHRKRMYAFWGTFGGVTALGIVVGILSDVFLGGWLIGVIMGGAMLAFYAFLLVPYVQRIQTPTHYAITSEGLYTRFERRPPPIASPVALAWKNLLHVREGFDPFLSIEPEVRTVGSKSLSFLESTGLVYHLTNVPTAVLDEVRRLLPQGVLQVPPDTALGTAPTPLR